MTTAFIKSWKLIVAIILVLNFYLSPVLASTTQNAPATMQLTVQKIIDLGLKKQVFIKLTTIQNGQAITLAQLKEAHTGKIHLLINNDQLNDYSHVHPVATKVPGIYEFSWYPQQKTGHYRVWADLLPIVTGQQEYVVADLTTSKVKANINRTTFNQSTVEGVTFKLSFDSPVQAGRPTMGNLFLTDQNGRPIQNLEPVMGAYAHIVGFSDDFKTIIHIHPMGSEPSKATDRGGPELQFHIEPQQAGFIKLFAQVKIKGKEIFAPFGIIVSKST